MVGTNWSPASITLIFCDLFQKLFCRLMIWLYLFLLLIRTFSKWLAYNTMNTDNIRNRPSVIERLYRENRGCNLLINIFSKHAQVLLVWVFFHTFGCWRIYLEIWEFKESCKLVPVSMITSLNIDGIKKYARIWNTINFCIFDIFIDILSPQKCSQPTSRSSRNNNLRGLGKQAELIFQWFKLCNCDIIASEI